MKVGEHTWGWAGGHTQTAPWDNAGLAMKIKDDASYAAAIASWTEQRSFVDNAVAALGEGKLADDIRAEWHALAFAPFDSTGFAVANASVDFQCGSTAIGFHAATGGVRLLRAGGKGHNWATPQHQLLAPWYQNVDAEYIKSFDFQYGGPTMGGNFGKAGLNLTAMNSTARLVTLLRRVGSHNTSFILKMAMDEAVHQERSGISGGLGSSAARGSVRNAVHPSVGQQDVVSRPRDHLAAQQPGGKRRERLGT